METTFLVIFTLFLFFQTYGASSSHTMITASSNVTSIQMERQSLLKFRKGLTDESNRLSTWTGVECCEWQGVGCDRRNGHVVKLDLRSPLSFMDDSTLNTSNWLEGKVSPSLLNLKHLRYLDLSMNNFSGQNIPEFFGSFKYLEYLNLSLSGFSGVVPPHLGNLSRLQYFDLNLLDSHRVHLEYVNTLMVRDDMSWVSSLSSLKHLDLSGINIGNHTDWFHPVNMLPSLVTLNLVWCDINYIPSIKFINFTSLNSLDLSYNGINSTIPVWLSNLTSLMHLNLEGNSFHGRIPDVIGKLSSLASIDLSSNRFNTLMPDLFWNLSSLVRLDLSSNEFYGPIPPSLGGLSSLRKLTFYCNQLSGSIPESIGLFTRLQVLSLAFNQLSGSIPESIGLLTRLQKLYLHSNQLNGVVSEIHFTKLNNLTRLDLSHNQIGGKLPRFQVVGNLPTMNPGLLIVNLGKNCFTGSVPTHLCELLSINILDLSDNNFSGVLPKCLGNLIQLRTLDLANNAITGDIPNSLGSLPYLQSLHLYNNKFEGNLPVALQNLTSLVTFDLGNNLLTGNIPSWIGKKLSKLKILNLQSNRFSGKIPLELCQNNALQHLNLANNSITGMIPRCFYNLTGMIVTSVNFGENVNFEYNGTRCEENIVTYIKGIQLKYTKTIQFLTSLDLSSNKIIGEIPDVLMNLAALNNLNLSRNLLSGQISERIGNLKKMESLDFSMNLLSGQIPPGLATLNFLSYLNLSFNNLSGQIPFGNQLQTLGDPSAIYGGNNELCGSTLLRSCNRKNVSDIHIGEEEDKDAIEDLWLLIGIGHGFIVGFMGLIGSLYFIKEWRVAYFEIIENIYAWLVVSILMTLERIQRKFF